jgi:nucleolar protein 56
MNLPKAKKEKKPKFSLGVQDSKLGNSISETMQVPLASPVRRSFGGRCAVEPHCAALARRCQVSCKCNEMTNELLRGVRAHFSRMVKGLKDGDIEKAQLGLAHSYSRSKVPPSGY